MRFKFFQEESSVSHGGARNGAGRKPGVPGKKTQAVIAKAEAEGIMPKDVLLNVMRWLYENKEYEKAAEVAKDAAPYFTPRLAAVAVQKLPDAGEQEEPVREIVVSTREEAATLLPLLTQASGIPERS